MKIKSRNPKKKNSSLREKLNLRTNRKRKTSSKYSKKAKKKQNHTDNRTRFVGIAIKTLGVIVIFATVSVLVYYIYLTQKYKRFDTIPDVGADRLEIASKPGDIYYALLSVNKELDPDHSFTELLYFLKFNYTNESITALAIPTDYYTWDFEGKNYQKLRNLRNLGAVFEPRVDTSYSIDRIDDMLGMKTNYYLNINESDLTSLISQMDGIRFESGNNEYNVSSTDSLLKLFQEKSPSESGAISNAFLKQFLIGVGKQKAFINEEWVYRIGTSFRTNLDNPEVFRLVNLLESQRLSFNSGSLDETTLREEIKVDPPIEVFDQDRVDFIMQNQFENVDIVKEQARFEIYNGTSERLLATYWGRIFRNSSLDVIRVGTVKEIPQTEVYIPGNRDDYKKSLDEIKRLLKIEPVIRQERPASITTTGDVIVILGKDVLE
ncbi:LCP family protein [Candidatus Dojkabacteria bacterium]|uniref:LCP family protein n=1 Tax=Candidatus Dojkabacteria bacterium TaxID=2099670 RepID=A0A955RI26_9BACT|nr:LCP family protein [Candidatus Dojkabacteria bacterium]